MNRPPFLQPLPLLLFLLCAGLFLVQCLWHWPSTIDDSYITFRFAENLLAGDGLRWHPDGPRVEGYTNFTWVLLSSLALLLRLDVMLAMKLAGLLCGLGTMAGAWRLTAELRGREDTLNVLPGLVLAANASFAHWAVQGMETLLQPLLIVWGTWFVVRETADEKRWLISPLFAALVIMTRPDSAPYLLPWAVWWTACAWRGVPEPRRFFTWTALCAAGAGGYWLARWAYFGDFFPNTWYAKVGGEAVNHTRGIAHVLTFFGGQGGWDGASALHGMAWMNLTVGALLVLLAAGTWRTRVLIAGPVLAGIAYVIQVGGDWMPNFRFLMVPLVFVAVAIALLPDALRELLPRAKPRLRRFLPEIVVALLLVPALAEQLRTEAVYIFYDEPDWYARERGWAKPVRLAERLDEGYALALEDVAIQLMLRTEDDTAIFMSDIGFPAWISPHLRVIDVDGLTDPYLAGAPSVAGETFGADGLAERNVRYVMEELRPEYILAFDTGGREGGGIIYPQPIADVLRHPQAAEYEEIWTGIKTGTGVYNRLYARPEAESPDTEERIARLQAAVRGNPRVPALVRRLYTEHALSDAPLDAETQSLVLGAIDRFARNERLLASLRMTAEMRGDAEVLEALDGTAAILPP